MTKGTGMCRIRKKSVNRSAVVEHIYRYAPHNNVAVNDGPHIRRWSHNITRVNQKVKTIFKLRGNREREELAHCAVLTMPVEEFSHVQYSAVPSVEWQQRGRKHGPSFARLHHRRTTWRSAVCLGRRRKTCGNSPSYVDSVWTEHHESTKGLWVGGKV